MESPFFVFTVEHYASVVYAVDLCLSVLLYVHHKLVFCQNG